MHSFHNGFCRKAGPYSILAIIAIGLVVAGCRHGDELPTAPVSGTVSYKGKPLSGGTVVFVPDTGQPATGQIQPGGTFQLSTYGKNDGAVIGKHHVQINCREQPKSQAAPGMGEPAVGKSLIPEKYVDFATSGLTFEVTAGNNEFSIDLKE